MPPYASIIVLSVILLMMTILFLEKVRPVLVFFMAAVVLFISGVISEKELLGGFANEQLAVVMLLLLLADLFRQTGLLDSLMKKLTSTEIGPRRFLARMMIISTGVSAFINNTPLVAIITPYTYDWAKRKQLAPSKLLMPIAFAITLGGTITLIGTSTNIIVNGFATDAGVKPVKMFEYTPIGLALAAVGLLYLFFIGSKLVPDRKDALADFTLKANEYLAETEVGASSSLIGKTIEKAGMRNLRGLFLVEIIRGDKRIAPAPRNEVIRAGDHLVFAGETSTIIDLLNSGIGVRMPKYSNMLQEDKSRIVEVVIAQDSSLNGKIVREADFRARFDSAIIAINRNGARLSGKLGEVRLRAGDLLLLITGDDFNARVQDITDLNIISRLSEDKKSVPLKLWILGTAALAAFILPACGILTLFKTLLLLMLLMIGMKIARLKDIKRGLDIDLYLILALALAIGKAITASGTDKLVADHIIGVLTPLHSPIAVLSFIFLLTLLLVVIINNKAGLAIVFPVAIAAANNLHTNTTPFIMAVALAGSCTFLSPYCYQVNLLIYGPGGYKFRDYVRMGWPLTLLYSAVTIIMLSIVYRLY